MWIINPGKGQATNTMIQRNEVHIRKDKFQLKASAEFVKCRNSWEVQVHVYSYIFDAEAATRLFTRWRYTRTIEGWD